ncbi:40S ribosomal protein [Bulinus truncatus]|nr:40S ribosomal protein [Bulinus truncatus]
MEFRKFTELIGTSFSGRRSPLRCIRRALKLLSLRAKSLMNLSLQLASFASVLLSLSCPSLVLKRLTCREKSYYHFVPVPQLKAYQKIQTRLVRELEKKFNGKPVVFIAQRRILPKPTRKSKREKNKQKRPRRRFIWIKVSKIMLSTSWIHLHQFIRKLTGKDVTFEFPRIRFVKTGY